MARGTLVRLVTSLWVGIGRYVFRFAHLIIRSMRQKLNFSRHFKRVFMNVKKIMGWIPCLGLICMIGLFSACSMDSSAPATQQTTASAAVNVNGFGTAANHVHSLIALSNHVLVLATHYGLFRSEDD